MTVQYRQVFVDDAATIAGPYEAEGPLKSYFDKTFDNLYHGEKTWETAEVKVLEDSRDIIVKPVIKDRNIVTNLSDRELSVIKSNYVVLLFSREI